jgi:hypothetical protein
MKMKKLNSLNTLVLFYGLSGLGVGLLQAETVFTDDFTVAVSTAERRQADPNALLSRQGGTWGQPVRYLVENPTGTPGSNGWIETNAPAFSPVGDVLMIQNLTSTSGLSMWGFELDADFSAELAGKLWRFSYDARLTSNMTGSQDNWLALGFGGREGSVDAAGSGSDVFTFAIRSNGQWLLWYRAPDGGQNFINEGSNPFPAQEQIRVDLDVDERGGGRLLTVTVTPLSGSARTVVADLPVATDNDSVRFEFRVAAITGGTPGQVADARIDNLELTVAD